MTLIDRLIQHGNKMLVRVTELDKEIADLQARKAGLVAKYGIPPELQGIMTHATEMMQMEESTIDRDITNIRAAKVICQRQADHNLGTPHSLYLGDEELNPLNNAVPRVDSDLRSDCLAAGLITWEMLDSNPERSNDDVLSHMSA
jgi:hypothetical protein